MTTKELATFCIEHTDSFPFTAPITIAEAKAYLNSSFNPSVLPESVTPEELVAAWNSIINELKKENAPMKASEIIAAHRAEIAESMADAYRSVLACAGRIQYKVYIWSDGEIERLEGPQGDNSYLVPKDTESRSLYYIDTVSAPYVDVWDLAEESVPDDESEKEAKEAEIIDCLVNDYKNTSVDYIIDNAIEKAKEDEEMDDMFNDNW